MEAHPRDTLIETILQIKEKECQRNPKVQNRQARFSWLASRIPIVPKKSIPRHLIVVALLTQDPPEVLEPINHLSHKCHVKSKIFHYIIVLFLSVTDLFWCGNSLQ